MTRAAQVKQYLRYEVTGARRLGTYLTAIACTIGGVGFTLAGLSSYTGNNLLLLSDTTGLDFFPQGIAMLFYGFAGSAVALFQWWSLAWNVGGGYNEFDRRTGKVTIYRQGFPGKNRTIDLQYSLDKVQSIRVELKGGLNPKRAIYLRIRGKGDIPLTRVGQPLALSEVENQGAELASFLNVPLEGI
jgi:hypothetical protein